MYGEMRDHLLNVCLYERKHGTPGTLVKAQRRLALHRTGRR